jgi:hypothetical protein
VLSGSNLNIIGTESNFNSRISINADGSMSVRTTERNLFTLAAGTYTNFNNNDTLTLNVAGTAATLTVGGNTYTATKVLTDTFSFDVLGKTGTVASQSGYVKGYELLRAGVLSSSVKINNKPAGAIQPAIFGSRFATIINYNSSGWVAI